MTGSQVPDAALLLFTLPLASKFFACWSTHPLAGREVQEVLPVARHYPLLQLAALLGQVWVLTAQSEFRQLVRTIEQAARHEIDHAMRIAGDEVHRPLLQVKRVKEF